MTSVFRARLATGEPAARRIAQGLDLPARARSQEDEELVASGFNNSSPDTRLSRLAPEGLNAAGIVALARWPQMRHLRGEQLADCARICALLAHSPSAVFLIHRRLDLPAATVQSLLADLHTKGHLRIDGDAGATKPSAQESEASPRIPTIWGKLLRRLLS